MHKAAHSVRTWYRSHFLCGCLAETSYHLCQQLCLIGLFDWLKVIYGMVVFYRKKKFSFQSHGHRLQIRLKPLLLLKYHTKIFFWKYMTCWACKCHTITSRKQEAKITGLFSSCYCRQDTSTCKGEGDTKILEKLQNYILFTSMATDTKIHTVFSWSWCTCHYTAPVLWSSPVIQISYQSTIPYCGKN